jgi:hypothetical protein
VTLQDGNSKRCLSRAETCPVSQPDVFTAWRGICVDSPKITGCFTQLTGIAAG